MQTMYVHIHHKDHIISISVAEQILTVKKWDLQGHHVYQTLQHRVIILVQDRPIQAPLKLLVAIMGPETNSVNSQTETLIVISA